MIFVAIFLVGGKSKPDAELAMTKKSYRYGEPIAIRLTIHNTLGDDLTIYKGHLVDPDNFEFVMKEGYLSARDRREPRSKPPGGWTNLPSGGMGEPSNYLAEIRRGRTSHFDIPLNFFFRAPARGAYRIECKIELPYQDEYEPRPRTLWYTYAQTLFPNWFPLLDPLPEIKLTEELTFTVE
jgi:hypothetical protein